VQLHAKVRGYAARPLWMVCPRSGRPGRGGQPHAMRPFGTL